MSKTPAPNPTTPTVDAISALDFTGNTIPHAWYEHILMPPRKKPTDPAVVMPPRRQHTDLAAIIILSEIIYWYRSIQVKDETTCKVVGVHRKFAEDKLQISYQALADRFGLGKREVTEAVHRLSGAGLITMEFRTVRANGLTLPNVLFVEPVPTAIAHVSKPFVGPVCDLSPVETGDRGYPPPERDISPAQTGDTPTPKRDTITESTTENQNREHEREKETRVLTHSLPDKSAESDKSGLSLETAGQSDSTAAAQDPDTAHTQPQRQTQTRIIDDFGDIITITGEPTANQITESYAGCCMPWAEAADRRYLAKQYHGNVIWSTHLGYLAKLTPDSRRSYRMLVAWAIAMEEKLGEVPIRPPASDVIKASFLTGVDGREQEIVADFMLCGGRHDYRYLAQFAQNWLAALADSVADGNGVEA